MRSGRSSKGKRKRSGGDGDLFGALPDELLNHVLSFLPSRQAVQASLLSRRWRHLWRSTPTISVSGEGDNVRLFIDNLLLRRAAASSLPPLRSFEIDANDLLTPPYDERRDYSCYHEDDRPKVDRHVDLWVDMALSACRASLLTVRTKNRYTPWRPRCPLAFASPHLTTLHLEYVHLVDGLLDFSCCPALRQLTFMHCHLDGDALVSPSLERLRVVDCEIEMYTDRTSTPSLHCLELSDRYGKDGWSMPWLADPSIQRTGKTTIYSRKK